VKLYGLSEKSIGDNFPLLADAMLEELLKSRSPVKWKDTFHALAQKLALRLGDDGVLNLPMAKRLSNVVERLNEMHYQARWEAGVQGPRILFAHCPYAAIIEKHPELCRIDEAFLAELTKSTTHQHAKIGGGPAGSPYCVFQVL
jgi:predicted ArsR family transcriptional regulator